MYDLKYVIPEISEQAGNAYGEIGSLALTDAQVLNVVEEAGEFAGAYRRSTGRARRAGSLDDVRHELADVIISSYVAAHRIGFDLDEAVQEKLQTVMTRGWKEVPR